MQYQEEIEHKLTDLTNLIKEYGRNAISNDQEVEAKIPILTEIRNSTMRMMYMVETTKNFYFKLLNYYSGQLNTGQRFTT